MALIVQKYGGTSVGSIDRIKAVAERVARRRAQGDQIVVVVSAMAGETNRLVPTRRTALRYSQRARDRRAGRHRRAGFGRAARDPPSGPRPSDSSLFSAISSKLRPTRTTARRKSVSVESARIQSALDQGNIVVVAGYQGVDLQGDITTLGRGASDLTAVALAAVLNAAVCEIYTDVDGVYTADPRICPQARRLDRISYDEMLEMAGLGAKVLQLRSVELARRFNVPLMVLSSFSDEARGTWVGQEDKAMENVLVSGVTLDQNQSKITLTGVEDRPGLAARIFGPIAEAGIVVDMIIQNASADGRTDMTFTVPRTDLRRALELVAPSPAKSAPPACATRTRWPRSRLSASACARMPALPQPCSRCWPPKASISR